MIRLRDNRFGNSALAFKQSEASPYSYASNPDDTEGLGGQKVSTDERTVLFRFGKNTLEELETLAEGAILDLSETHLETGSRKNLKFFEFHGKEEEGPFRLATGNLMGVLRFRNKDGASVQVEVLSRFDKGNDNFFLNYLLSKAFNCAIGAESVLAERSPLLELLLDIVFVRRLGEAAKAGLLRHYREFRNNDWNFKGSLDLARHIRENVPLMHGIAYRKREIDLDVPVNRMILMAALTVNRRHPGFFESNSDAADALRQLRMGVTEERDLRAILSRRDCREPVRHPFFREIWEPLRRIARMILEDERWTLFPEEATDDAEVSGVVFDGSWLWEEYVATILTPKFRHCVRGGTYDQQGLKMLEDGPVRFYPDFYLKTDEVSERVVLDAKYKRFNPNGQRSDVHQVLCYMLLTGAKLGGFVFPPVDEKCEDKEAIQTDENGGSDIDKSKKSAAKIIFSAGWSKCRMIASPYSKIEEPVRWRCFSWGQVPDAANCDWDCFCHHMNDQENKLKKGPPDFPFGDARQ